MIAERLGTIARCLFQNSKELIRDMPLIPSVVNRQRRLFAPTGPSVDLLAEEQRDLRIAMADLLLNALAGRSGSTPAGSERSTEDESKVDR
jgi:hypothetical protein